MDNKISPQEFNLLSDIPIIRTRCPYQAITEEMIVMQAKRGNLAAGDSIRVQCMDNELSELIAEVDFRITSRKTSLVTAGADTQSPRTFEDTVFHVKQLGDWWVVNPVEVEGGQPYDEMKAVWMVGKGGYDIVADGQVVGFEKDKETAHAIAAGKLPLPAMEEA